MKKIAIIPIKQNSERVPGKNFRFIAGKPLYLYLLDNLKYCNFDDIYVDSDSDEIREYCSSNGYNFLQRKPELALNTANGNDLLNYHRQLIDSDLYFQLFVTSPLLKVETINKCIELLSTNNDKDSIMTVKSFFSWYWYDGKPINYDPCVLPRSQDAKPVVMETTGLYGIKKQSLDIRKARIGFDPIFHEVSDFESIDLDNETDFEYLNYYVQNNSSSSNC